MAIANVRKTAPVVFLLATVLFVVGVNGIEGIGSSSEHVQDVQDQLVGTWARDGVTLGRKVHHVLTMERGGVFREDVQVFDAQGRVTEHAHEGTWLYDGTNLKRKYTMIDGKPPSRLNVPFATFEISFPARNEFVGVDHIYGNRIEYRRVAAGS